MNNPAFEYLRQFKKVSDESEELVMKVVKKRYPEISLNVPNIVLYSTCNGLSSVLVHALYLSNRFLTGRKLTANKSVFMMKLIVLGML